MKSLDLEVAPRCRVNLLDRHTYICDLVYFEGPLLCLFRDAKHNWLYLWSDTDGHTYERWIVFRVERQRLVDYLYGKSTLLDLLVDSTLRYVLDQSVVLEKGGDTAQAKRALRQLRDLSCVSEYLPSSDSHFDESMAPDISLAREVIPEDFSVPLDGDWFFSDLDKFSRVYSQLYSFFYCAKPRFVTNIGERLRAQLRAPWKGGFSRLNLFDALGNFVPSLHDLKIQKIYYASPGAVSIQALKSVGDDISAVVMGYLERQDEIDKATKAITQLLSAASLRRRDVSHLTDPALPLRKENLDFLNEQSSQIVTALRIREEFENLCVQSPNSVITAKVILAVVGRVAKMAKLQRAGLVPYTDEL